MAVGVYTYRLIKPRRPIYEIMLSIKTGAFDVSPTMWPAIRDSWTLGHRFYRGMEHGVDQEPKRLMEELNAQVC